MLIEVTKYMVLSGLVKNGYYSLAYEIANKYLDAVVKVFNESGTVWKNYAPENARKRRARNNRYGKKARNRTCSLRQKAIPATIK